MNDHPVPLALPLFEPNTASVPSAAGTAAGRDRRAERASGSQMRPTRTRSEPTDRHLAEAKRLSRMIRKTAPRSPEQVRTGQLICRHLIAMLDGPGRAGGLSPAEGLARADVLSRKAPGNRPEGATRKL